MSDQPAYELFADDISVWKNSRPPVQLDIDRAAIYATRRGWNGTQLELRCDGSFRGLRTPSAEALESD